MGAPAWFIVLGAIALVLYLLFRIFISNPFSNIMELLKGRKSGCGCLLGIVCGIIVCGIVIWYIISEVF